MKCTCHKNNHRISKNEKKKTIYYDRVHYGRIWMCQCVIYRGTCFLWRFSWPHKTQRCAGTKSEGTRMSSARGVHRKWEKQPIATPLRRPDSTSHVAVIFTTLALDCVAFFARNHFDVRASLPRWIQVGGALEIETGMFPFLLGIFLLKWYQNFIFLSNQIRNHFYWSFVSFVLFLCTFTINTCTL